MTGKIFFSLQYFFLLNYLLIGSFLYSEHVSLGHYLANQKNISVFNSIQKIDVKNKIKRVVIICPAYLISGGPENLCQMYAALKKLGYEVYCFWVNPLDISNSIVKKHENGVTYLCKNSDVFVNSVYQKKYNVNYLNKDLLLDEETLVILPEIWSDFIFFFEKSKKAIAWLSISYLNVDNLSQICTSLIKENKLGILECLHLAQAPWIQKVLRSWGADSLLIGDYISGRFFIDNSMDNTKNKAEKLITFFPRKGGNLARIFVNKYPDLDYVKLENFTEDEMIFVLDMAKIYIDFGYFPGKDRIPREAILRNCVIFIHNKGCASDIESFPIDDYFRFSEQDITDGTLYNKVQTALADYKNMKKLQESFKEQIYQEKDLFEARIKEFVGQPKN